MSVPASSSRCRERGVALVFVLWAGALLSAIVLGVSLTTSAQLASTTGTVDRLRAEMLADAGLRAGVSAVVDGARRQDGRAPRRLELELPEGTVTVEISSESGRVDLNTAAEPLVRGLADVVTGGDGEALAEAWLARRAGEELPPELDPLPDMDAETGAEDPAAELAPSPTGTFTVKRELLDLPGVDREVYARLEAATTVHARQRGIDPLSAARDVLLALPGATEALIDEFIAERDMILSEGHDRGDEAYLFGRLRARLPSAQTLLALRRPAVFSVSALARLPNGVERTRIATVSLRRTPERQFSILHWSDDLWRIAESADSDADEAG